MLGQVLGGADTVEGFSIVGDGVVGEFVVHGCWVFLGVVGVYVTPYVEVRRKSPTHKTGDKGLGFCR